MTNVWQTIFFGTFGFKDFNFENQGSALRFGTV